MTDMVNHPPHYTGHPSGVECIQITEHMGFNLGNAIKYVWRADSKGDAISDLEKAKWYIERELCKRHVMVEPVKGSSGWVSDMYRCGDDDTPEQQINGNVGARSHPAHRYGRNSGQWCDGYI